MGPGEKLGAYLLIDRLGAGGMGEVWKAEDPRLGRTVAIKILPPGVTADQEAILRLQREARTAAQLYHPNIATIHSIEEDDGRLFIVMEYVPGDPLTKLIRERSLSEADVCRIGRGVAEALAEAHEKGIVHRDIKPDNIIVNGQRVKVLDFGVAKRVGFESTSSDSPTASFITQQGMIVGTVHYMSPEQALGKPLDTRTDIFSLGVVMYEAITGRLPFGGETVTETITQIVRDEPTAPVQLNSTVSPGFNAIIQRCLRKSRDERFATATDLASALDAQTARAATELMTAPTMVKPVRAIPTAPPTVKTAQRAVVMRKPQSRGWVWGLVVLVVAVAAAAIFMTRKPPQPVVAAPVTSTPAQTTMEVVDHEPIPPPPPVAVEPSPTAPPVAPSPAAAGEGGTEHREGPGEGAPEPDPKSHFRAGYDAILEHDFGHAERELHAALQNPDQLTTRERMLAEICLALAAGDRMHAGVLGRDFNRLYPNDADFERIKHEFAPEPLQRPRPPFPRRRPGRP